MPQVTVYVRQEDLDKWKAIDRKSEFIHQALNKTASSPSARNKVNELKESTGIMTADEIKYEPLND